MSNALAVLDYLADAGEAGVSEIAREVGVTVGTAHRLVTTLVSAGYAAQNSDNRRYRLSAHVADVGRQVRASLDAFDIAHRFLLDLESKVHETCNLAILSGTEVLYVDNVASSRPFGMGASIGSRLPVYCTALGKILVANVDEEHMSEQIRELRSAARRGAVPTPPQVGEFKREIAQIKVKGYALDLGGYLPDLYCAAAPIRGADGTVVAALSVSVPRLRFLEHEEYLIRRVQAAADGLSQALEEAEMPEHPRELMPKSERLMRGTSGSVSELEGRVLA